MDAEKVVLVVGTREFSISRKLISDSSSYFRELLEDRPAQERKLRLQGVPDADAFAALLEYITENKAPFGTEVEVVLQSLKLADKFSVGGFFEQIQKGIFTSWKQVSNIGPLLELSDQLHVREKLLKVIFQNIRNMFVTIGKGRKLSDTGENIPADFHALFNPLSCPTHTLVLDVLRLDEFKHTSYSRFSEDYVLFFKGMMDWSSEIVLDDVAVEALMWYAGLECFTEKFINETFRMNFIRHGKEHGLQGRINLKSIQIKKEISNRCFQVCVLKMKAGNVSISQLDSDNWKWDTKYLVDKIPDNLEKWSMITNGLYFSCKFFHESYYFSKSNTGPIFEHRRSRKFDFVDSLSSIRRFRVYMNASFFNSSRPESHEFFRNNTLQTGRIFCTGSNIPLSPYTEKTFFVCYLDLASPDMFPTILAEGKLGGTVHGCQLIQSGDLLHGFVGHDSPEKGSKVSHFCLPSSTSETEEISFQPVLQELEKTFIPMAAAMVNENILLLLSHQDGEQCVAIYNCDTSELKVLGFLPLIPEFNPTTEYVYYLKGFTKMEEMRKTSIAQKEVLKRPSRWKRLFSLKR